jgi:pimeloyl-ACP methyl ester carboxylesterase
MAAERRIGARDTVFNEVDGGGHFAAWEEPQLFAEEVRAAFRSVR